MLTEARFNYLPVMFVGISQGHAVRVRGYSCYNYTHLCGYFPGTVPVAIIFVTFVGISQGLSL